MAKTFIFAIGGTGCRVLRSLTMLMASGMDGLEGEICPIIIDYDAENGDKRRAETVISKYMKVREILGKSKSSIDPNVTNEKKTFFSGSYTPILKNGKDDVFTWQFDASSVQNQKFRDYIDFDHSGSTQDLLECLYDNDNSATYSELNLDMTVGFQGNPNLGSVVFDNLKNDSSFKDFENKFDEGDKVIIIGSIFGGTGSSGIPKIISAIRNHTQSIIKSANLSLILVLPYFQVNSSNQKISINSTIFNSKTKAALSYYETSKLNQNIDNIYYVGDKDGTKVEPHIGSNTQVNDAHVTELISALAIVDAIGRNQSNNDKFKFSLFKNVEDGLGISELVAKDRQDSELTDNMLHSMINFMYAMRYYVDYIVPNKLDKLQFAKSLGLIEIDKKRMSVDGKNHLQDFCCALFDFLCEKPVYKGDTGYFDWIKELHNECHGKHRLKLFNFDYTHIVDLLQGEDRTGTSIDFKSKGGMFGFGDGKPMFKFDDQFDSWMNSYLKNYIKGNKLDIDIKGYPWIFCEILYSTVNGKNIERYKNESFCEEIKQFNNIP